VVGKNAEKRTAFLKITWLRIISSLLFYVFSIGFLVIALSLSSFFVWLGKSQFASFVLSPIDFLGMSSLTCLEVIGYCSLNDTSPFEKFPFLFLLIQWTTVIGASCWLAKNRSYKAYLIFFVISAFAMIFLTFFILEILGHRFHLDVP